jgi:hypothetical protein
MLTMVSSRSNLNAICGFIMYHANLAPLQAVFSNLLRAVRFICTQLLMACARVALQLIGRLLDCHTCMQSAEPQNYGCDQTADKCGFRLDHNISIWFVLNDLDRGDP